MVGAEVDPLIGAARDAVLMAAEDATRLKLDAGDSVVLRNELGEYLGRIVIDRVKPGSVQVYWPEANAVIPAGRLDPCGIPDYNATVEIVSVCG
jgi:formylmethanofuran dehydrogenase subunit D